MSLKVERSSLQFINLNLLRNKQTKTELSEALPLQSVFQWLGYLSSGGRTIKDFAHKTYSGILSITLALKFNLSTELFLQVERIFPVLHVHKKLAFLTHLIAYS